jgi:hypothetical protein
MAWSCETKTQSWTPKEELFDSRLMEEMTPNRAKGTKGLM